MCFTPAAPHRDLLRTCFHDFPAGPPWWCFISFRSFFLPRFCRSVFRWACRPSCDGCSGPCPRSCRRKSVCLFRNVLEFGHGPRIEKPWAHYTSFDLLAPGLGWCCFVRMCVQYVHLVSSTADQPRTLEPLSRKTNPCFPRKPLERKHICQGWPKKNFRCFLAY